MQFGALQEKYNLSKVFWYILWSFFKFHGSDLQYGQGGFLLFLDIPS